MADLKSEIIRRSILDHKGLIQSLEDNADFQKKIEEAARLCIGSIRNEGKVLFCGNGGSAADAQHLATELSGKFYLERDPVFAEALHVNTSFVTAVGNDYDFSEIFARSIKAKGRRDDVLIGLSTSGNSRNVVKAVIAAREKGMKVIAMTGQTGGELKESCDVLLNVPSDDTPRIQEMHILIGHIICEMIEYSLFHQD